MESKYIYHASFSNSELWFCSERIVLADAEDRIIGALAGGPRDQEDFQDVISDVEALLKATAPSVKIRKCAPCKNRAWDDQCRKCRERRGNFKTLSIGISYGGGQTVSHTYSSTSQGSHVHLKEPGNLDQLNGNQEAICNLLGSKSVTRLAGYQSSELFRLIQIY